MKFTAWDGYITGRHLQLKSGKKIVQEWSTSEFPNGYPPSILELTFKAKKGGTEIVMTHSKVPASQTARYREGWVSAYWNPLREYFAKKS
jgi:activator of HSP90 ATPase